MRRMFGIHKKGKFNESSVLFPRKIGRWFVRGTKIRNNREIRSQESHAWSIHSWQLWVLWGVFAGVFGYQLFFSGALGTTRVVVFGTGLLTSDEVEQVVREAMRDERRRFLPRENLMMLSVSHIETRLRTSFPLIRQVTITKVFPDTVVVSLLERGDLLFWCISKNQCSLVNEEGFLENQLEALGELRVPRLFLVDETGKPEVEGYPVVTPELVTFLKGLQQAFQERTDIVIREHIFIPSKYADELRLETENGFSIRIGTNVPIEQTLSTLRVVREKAVPRERISELLAVDLRIPGKAFYRLREDVSEEFSSVSVDGSVPHGETAP